MNRNIQWNSVILKVEELRKDLEYILNQKQSLPLIEVDIVLNKLSLLYDTLMSIKLQAATNEENGFFSKNSSLISKIIKESVFNENEFTDYDNQKQDKLKKEEIKNEENSLIFTAENKQVDLKSDIAKNSTQNNEKQTKPTEPKQLKTVADTIAKPSKTLAEMMEEIYKKRDVATSQQFKSIKDLKHAISINDKIMFIRELFNNNVDNYNYVLDQVNSCNNLDEALAILDKNVKIDSNNLALNTLLELIYRRFLN